MKNGKGKLNRAPDEILRHYAGGVEEPRLSSGWGQLEFVRSQDIIERFLAKPPCTILDIGGGPGVYAAWLAKKGYEVKLIDPVPLHIKQAHKTFADFHLESRASAALGNALNLDIEDGTADAILFMGPMYHLTKKADRLQALSEAFRALRPGGIMFIAAISRFASLLDGLNRGFIRDPVFADIVKEDLSSGLHSNPTDNPDYFSTAYFHHPNELETELREARFQIRTTLAVEGPAWVANAFDELWDDAELRKQLLAFIGTVENERSIIGASPHILAVAQKPLHQT